MSNEVLERSFQFALKIINFSNKMYRQSYENRPIIQQLLKSGTSIGANIEEAVAAQSRRDFLTKMYISYKEARETNYWLRLLKELKIFNQNEITSLINESIILIKLLSAITKSTKRNL